MTGFFPHTRGSFTLYCGGADDAISNVRFVLGHFGEDAQLIVEQFWKEHRGDYTIVPVFGYGGVPRRELCTQQSLVTALQSVSIEAGGMIEMKWKKLCEELHVAWPKRLTAAA
jgi:hypothetical protein